MNEPEKLPGVSVIVPACNNQSCIAELIESLLGQDYPEELVEIIIVDNNSTDQTKEIIKQYPVVLLEENDIQSSYAARNKGIKHARNSIFAFIDADCVAVRQWLKEGIKSLLSESVDLVGGKVEFVFSNKRTPAEMYDSITHFNFEKSIGEQKATGAGNLFVYSAVFEKVGSFPEVKSGGDFQWTSLAVSKGFVLAYCGEAVVQHPTRKLAELLKKRFRTGLGSVRYWRQIGLSRRRIAMLTARKFFPRRPCYIRKAIETSGTDDMKGKLMSIFWVAWLSNIVSILAILVSMLPLCGKKN